MMSADDLLQKFNSLYSEIDCEIELLRKSQKSLVNKQQFEDFLFKSVEKFSKNHNNYEVVNILNHAKKMDQKQKTITNIKIAKKNFIKNSKSIFPPIWDEKKLNIYTQNVLNDIFTNEISNEPDKSTETMLSKDNNDIICTRKTILNGNSNSKMMTRNVGTNVRFLIQKTKENYFDENPNLCVKRVNKKIQTALCNDLKTKPCKANEKSFPQRIERVVNNEESVSVNFKDHYEISKMPQKHQLAFSATTFTSTNGQKISTKSDDIIHVLDSSLVTNATKQMSSVLLPVLSIKGKCSVQNIYHFEILPTSDDSLHNNKCNNEANIKFIELKYGTECTESKKENESDEIIKNSTAPDLTENRNKLFDMNDIKNTLRYYNVNIDDGKIHVVLENSKNMDIQNKRRKLRKKIKKKHKDFTLIGYKGTASAKQEKLCANKNHENIQNEVDSSSSLTDDDRKLCDILKFYGKMNETKEKSNKDDNIFSCEDRYPYPTNTSSNETQNNQNNLTNEVKLGNDLEYNNITESFQSIYKLIEDTFQSNLMETEVCENEKENGMSEMNQVIKMSEENIRKAELLLQKYKNAKGEAHPYSLDENQESCRNTMTEKPKIFFANNELNLYNDRQDKSDENYVNNSYQLKKEAVQQDVIYANDKCQEYAKFTKDLQEKLHLTIETLDSSVQTTSDKALQTEDNFDCKTKFYFKSVFDNYTNVNFDAQNNLPAKRTEVFTFDSINNIPGN